MRHVAGTNDNITQIFSPKFKSTRNRHRITLSLTWQYEGQHALHLYSTLLGDHRPPLIRWASSLVSGIHSWRPENTQDNIGNTQDRDMERVGLMGNKFRVLVKLDNSDLHACLKLFPRCEDVYGPPMCWDIVTSSLSLSHSGSAPWCLDLSTTNLKRRG